MKSSGKVMTLTKLVAERHYPIDIQGNDDK